MFIGLLTAFVFYRLGKSESNIQSSPNGSAMNTTANIPISKTDTAKKPTMMSSSKVLILTDQSFSQQDTVKSLNNLDTSKKKKIEMMSSSKSAILFTPNLKVDTTKSKMKNEQ